jgi:RES domain-containing protein
LYTSLTRAGAIAEYHKELAKVSGISAEEDHPRDLVSIHVVAKCVLDLTKPSTRKRMGISLETITGDRVPDIDACRAIADLARLQGYRGILSPSAAADGIKNRNLYIDGRADDVSLMEGVESVMMRRTVSLPPSTIGSRRVRDVRPQSSVAALG